MTSSSESLCCRSCGLFLFLLPFRILDAVKSVIGCYHQAAFIRLECKDWAPLGLTALAQESTKGFLEYFLTLKLVPLMCLCVWLQQLWKSPLYASFQTCARCISGLLGCSAENGQWHRQWILASSEIRDRSVL